jgi:hypothetical protein
MALNSRGIVSIAAEKNVSGLARRKCEACHLPGNPAPSRARADAKAQIDITTEKAAGSKRYLRLATFFSKVCRWNSGKLLRPSAIKTQDCIWDE